MAAVDAPPPPVEPDLEEARIEVDDVDWSVRVLGRAGGVGPAVTPLLLLGFWREGTEDGGPEKEALVVGRALADMTPAALRRALEMAVPPPPPAAERGDGKKRGGGGRGGGRRGRRS